MTIKEYIATDENKIVAEKWFSHLRDMICKEFEQIENSNSNSNKIPLKLLIGIEMVVEEGK